MAPQASFFDPIVGVIVVASRWGEVAWITTAGKVMRRARQPGDVAFGKLNGIWAKSLDSNDLLMEGGATCFRDGVRPGRHR